MGMQEAAISGSLTTGNMGKGIQLPDNADDLLDRWFTSLRKASDMGQVTG